MKKNRKIMPLMLVALFGIATLSGCAGQGNSDAKWYNPATWDWTWANPVNWFKDKDADEGERQDSEDPDGSETSGSELEPEGRYALGVHKFEAFGAQNKKTLTLTITPSDATVTNITWSSDKTEIVVTKLTNTTAEVYATKGLPADQYATITATEAFSGVSGTGKVYAIAPTEVVDGAAPPHNYALWVGENPNSTTMGKKISDASGQNHFGRITVSYEQQYQPVKLSISYKGSQAPFIRYVGKHQGGTIQNTSASTNRYPSNVDGYNLAIYTIYVFEPDHTGQAMQYEIMSAKYSDGPNSDWTDGVKLYELSIASGTMVQNIDIGDTTIFH